ncbi:uncharacterized protein UHO2_05230 [Ustilago hordei]|uniref:uncharacterized protein n=1 Tax=Ustilago hordei TaxID=120017 RepID=UPI001A3E061C|nr:uncharacterized protein UHO2_05230 [Ustilago hordei]SYW80671.1 related to retrotransposon protein [Ustilago hordei]
MGLVSISNQAPRGEAEKIPKDVLSAIAHIKKLSDNNWHTWEPTFIDCLQQVHNAKEILYSKIAPGSKGYDEDLDKVLVGLIHACCDHSLESCIDTYTIRGVDEEAQLGSMLYAKLRKALTLNDMVKQAGLQDCIHTVCLYNRDVVRLGKELDSIWNDAAHLGKRLDEDLKKSMLYCCMAQDWFYANSVDALKMAKPDCKYDEAYHALAKKQQDGEISGHIRGAARVATSTEQGGTSQVEQGPRGSKDSQISMAGDEKLQNNGTQVQFRKNRRQGCFDVRGQALALELEETTNNVPEDNQNTGNQDNNSKEDKDSYLWHERFGHPGRDKTRQIWAHYLSTDERMEHESKHCNTCNLKGHANYHYALVAVDNFSSLIYMEPLCTKSAALPALRRWITRMEQATDRKLKTLCSDNGGEWCSLGAEDWQTQEGFKWQKSIPGITTKTIPHEAFYGTTTHKLAQQLQVFGCLAWVHVQWKDQQGKYGARAKPAIMIGYDDEHKAWKFCNPDQPASIQWSNSATFHEDKGWSDHQQEAVWPMVTMEVEEEGATPAIVEEETRSEATVEDLLPAVDSTVGTTNTAVLNLDPTLGEAMNGEDAQLWKEAI